MNLACDIFLHDNNPRIRHKKADRFGIVVILAHLSCSSYDRAKSDSGHFPSSRYCSETSAKPTLRSSFLTEDVIACLVEMSLELVGAPSAEDDLECTVIVLI